jgi:hypothetical protein
MAAEEVLATGSPLYTLAILLSGQLQPPKDSVFERTVIFRNRTLGWDRTVLSQGDSLFELGKVHYDHFCYSVYGCPVTSILHPSTRIAIVGSYLPTVVHSRLT